MHGQEDVLEVTTNLHATQTTSPRRPHGDQEVLVSGDPALDLRGTVEHTPSKGRSCNNRTNTLVGKQQQRSSIGIGAGRRPQV